MKQYDVVVMGAGITGLAAAYAAARRGLKVAVVEKDSKCVAASIRNFGFVNVTGQRGGEHWQRAMSSRDTWAKLAPRAGIEVVHTGLLIPAYRAEAAAVCEAFLQTEMGEACRMLDEKKALQLVPNLQPGAECYLWSPHELRVESSQAMPQLASWLKEEYEVAFHWSTTVQHVELPCVTTSEGTLKSRRFIGCPGHDFSLIPQDALEEARLQICTLQMLRLDPSVEEALNTGVMSDLSLAHYEGFTALPEAAALQARLDAEMEEVRQAGIHVLAVGSANGSLVVGDSHTYGAAETPFARNRYEQMILQGFDDVFCLPQRRVTERWMGSYASAADTVFTWQPSADSLLGIAIGDTGAATGFAFGEELVARILNE